MNLDFTYTYDATGNRTKMTRPSIALPLPNQVSNTSYNDANDMLTFNDKNITYDNNGNMTSVTNSCGTTTYTWDVRNRLTAITGVKSDCSPLTASFNYDALGRRIGKTINGRTIQYLYDEMDIVQEIENGLPSVNYVRTLNIDEPLARLTPNALRFYQMDALGSVIALTDENGVLKTTFTYDPFGSTTASGEASDNPFQYTGRENDGTGLYYYRARYYSPELQRFISEDPIGLAGGINLYAYVGNSPVNNVDPDGLQGGPPYIPPPGWWYMPPPPPRGPGAGEPGPGACRWVQKRYCKYEDLTCPWETKCTAIVKNLDKCQCRRWSFRLVYMCGDKEIVSRPEL